MGRSGRRWVTLARGTLHQIAAISLAVIGVAISAWTISSPLPGTDKDVTEYWAAGRLLLEHANPYEEATAFRLEKEAGATITHAQVAYNPPNALLFALPFGLFNAHWAIILWALMVIASIVASIRILWILHGRRPDRTHLLGYVFAPVLACVSLGQIAPLALLPLVLFLWLHKARPFLAGFCIALLAVKPQLLIPFALVGLLWTITEKRYSLLKGALLGLAVACIVPLYFDHRIFADYLPILHAANAFSHGMPNLSSLIHRLFPSVPGSQYVLSAIGCLWAVRFFYKHRQTWDWNRGEGLLLILLSVVTAPYSWFQDEALVLPAILSAIYVCTDFEVSLLGFAVINGLALLMVMFTVPLFTGAYLWTSVAWLCWYVWASCRINKCQEAQALQSGAVAAWTSLTENGTILTH